MRFPSGLWSVKRFLATFFFLSVSFMGLAQTNDVFVQRHSNRWRLGYERVKLPDSETMGLASAHYDLLGPLDQLPGLYLGFGGYGAVDGARGGLFVWGPSAGWRQEIYRGLALDAGVFAAGGAVRARGRGAWVTTRKD